MSKATGIAGRFASALRGLGIKAPWQITGPTSSPEYMSHLPKATEYRIHAPTSIPTRPSVPHAEDSRVYDIKYYTRDSRRAFLRGGTKTMEKIKVTPAAKEGEGAVSGPPTPGQPMKWKGEYKSILDNEHNGYTL